MEVTGVAAVTLSRGGLMPRGSSSGIRPQAEKDLSFLSERLGSDSLVGVLREVLADDGIDLDRLAVLAGERTRLVSGAALLRRRPLRLGLLAFGRRKVTWTS
jgi:hypothetical protein